MKYLKIFTDFLEVAAPLSDGALGRLFRAMLRYALDGTELPLKGREGVLWTVARQHIDREAAAYDSMVEARREAGRRGADARWQKMAKHGKNGQDKDKEKDKDKDKDKDIYIAPAPGAHIYIRPPSLEEVTAYCRERGNQVDPHYFHSYYESNGWKVGKNPMKDWKAAVRSWESNGMGDRPAVRPIQEQSSRETFLALMDRARKEEAKQISLDNPPLRC